MSILTAFNKSVAAFRTGDPDLPFSFGNADLLLAVGTGVDMIILTHTGHIPFPVKAAGNTVLNSQKLIIFLVSLIDVPGKSPEIRNHKKGQGNQVEYGRPGDQFHNHQHKGQDQNKLIQLVITISADHKTLHTVSYSVSETQSNLLFSEFIAVIINRTDRQVNGSDEKNCRRKLRQPFSND